MKKTLFTGFAPNLRIKDLLQAMKFLFFPWLYFKWFKGDRNEKVEKWLADFYGVKHVITIDSGRSALLLGLQALGLNKGDEVIVQAFTCVVVVNAIKQSGAVPVYVDVNEMLNIDVDDLRKKISDKTKAVIVQHTFGNPADMEMIVELCNQENVKIIEDCAHSIGVKYNGKKVGTFGEFAILSFGSDKCVSCVRGGALVTNNDSLFQKAKTIHDALPNTKRGSVAQDLMHYIVFFKGKLLYSLFLGKVILALSKKMGLTGRIICDCEKKGKQTDLYPAKMPNCLARLLLIQLKDFNNFVEHRKKIALLYEKEIDNNKVTKPNFLDGAIPLRYNLFVDDPESLAMIAKKQGVFLGNWYRGVIAPPDIDMETTGYRVGMCPAADKFANRSINLPTNININEKDAKRIIDIVNKF